MIVPAERWVDAFWKFTDTEILNPDYALARFSRGLMCKLCGGYVSGTAAAHMAEHRIDLARYRADRKAAADARATAILARVREEQASLPPKERQPREGGSGLSDLKRAYNRITSLRYKLAHPEKSGKPAWTDAERTSIQATLDAAVTAHATLKTT